MSSISKGSKSWRIFLVFLGISMIFSLLLLRVWFSSKAVELACDIDRLAKKIEVLKEENNELSLKTAKLKSPERISQIATTDLNMVRSSDAEVVILER